MQMEKENQRATSNFICNMENAEKSNKCFDVFPSSFY